MAWRGAGMDCADDGVAGEVVGATGAIWPGVEPGPGAVGVGVTGAGLAGAGIAGSGCIPGVWVCGVGVGVTGCPSPGGGAAGGVPGGTWAQAAVAANRAVAASIWRITISPMLRAQARPSFVSIAAREFGCDLTHNGL